MITYWWWCHFLAPYHWPTKFLVVFVPTMIQNNISMCNLHWCDTLFIYFSYAQRTGVTLALLSANQKRVIFGRVYYYNNQFNTSHTISFWIMTAPNFSLFSLSIGSRTTLLVQFEINLHLWAYQKAHSCKLINLYSLGGLFSHCRSCDILQTIILWSIQKPCIHIHGINYLKIWKQDFSRVSSHGLKWGHTPSKLKRSIPA